MVLIFIDTAEGHVKKASLEAISYGAAIAAQMGVSAGGVALGKAEDLASLGKYGGKKIHQVSNAAVEHFDAQVFTKVIDDVTTKTGAKASVFANHVDGKAIARRLSASP